MEKEEKAYQAYLERTGFCRAPIDAALIDMDGVLYDSMKNHSAAWTRLASELGWKHSPDEFYLYEGMTGAAIIRLLMKRECGRSVSDDEARTLYARKAQYFISLGTVGKIDGATEMLETLRDAGIIRVLVTGSGQSSLLNRLEDDYRGIFLSSLRVTAYDVQKGKPDPEPYLMGQRKAGVPAERAIVIENAPLGVKAGSASGSFTVGVTTGPIPENVMYAHGADIVYPSMRSFAEALPRLISLRSNP